MSPRLTTASYLVLGLVDMMGSATPYDLKQVAAEHVSAFWTLPHTQIYAQADKLVEAGLLAQRQEEEGRRRRILTITDEGRDALREWRADTSVVPVEARDLGLLKLFFGADPWALAPAQVEEHQRRLEDYLALQAADALPEGPAGTLAFGIAYETALVDFWTARLTD